MSAALASARNSDWYIAGFKGFYEGSFESLFHEPAKDIEACFDDETLNYIDTLEDFFKEGPSGWLHDLADVRKEFEIFEAYAEALEDVMNCHFEDAMFDM